MAAIRILIADGHEIVRHGLRRLIEAQSGREICGEAASAEALFGLAISQSPDVVVLGVPLPGLDSAPITDRLRSADQGPEVVLYAAGDDLEAISTALTAGARGCVLKAEDLGQLTAAIGALVARRAYLSPAAAQLLGQTAADGRQASAHESLTSREMQVVQLIAAGESSRTIAEILKISPKTAESHRAAAMRKSGARSIAHLVRFAIRRRLISN